MRALVEEEPLQGPWFDRTREYAARARREKFGRFEYATPETIRLEPLPCWFHHSKARYKSRVGDLITEIETETASRHAREGTRPLGVAAILAQNAHDKPSRSTKAVRRELVEAYRWFLGAYLEAAEKLRNGDLSASFPEGSFPPRLPFVGWVPDSAPGSRLNGTS